MASEAELVDLTTSGHEPQRGAGGGSDGEEGAPSQRQVEGAEAARQKELFECAICMEPVTADGEHALASLGCGHLFGLSCIKKWLAGRSGPCPQCKKRTRRGDVRRLYVPGGALSVLDNSRAEELCEGERQRAEAAERKVRRLQDQVQSLAQQLELQAAAAAAAAAARCSTSEATVQESNQPVVERQRRLPEGLTEEPSFSAGPNASLPVRNRTPVRPPASLAASARAAAYELEAVLPMHGCRCFALDLDGCALLLPLDAAPSRPSLAKVSLAEGRAAAARLAAPSAGGQRLLDIQLNGALGMAAMVGHAMQHVHLVALDSGFPAAALQLPGPAWSCCWSAAQCHQLYVGLHRGQVLLFDTRRAHAPLRELQVRSGAASMPVRHLASAGLQLQEDASAELLLAGNASCVSACVQGGRAAAHDSDAGAGGMLTKLVDGNCESLALLRSSHGADASPLLCTSLRGASPSHRLFRIRPFQHAAAPAASPGRPGEDAGGPAAASADSRSGAVFALPGDDAAGMLVQEQSSRGGLAGHSSRWVMTRGCVLDAPGQGSGADAERRVWLVGADEDSCRPWVWDAASGRHLFAMEAHPAPVLQLSGGCCPAANSHVLLAASKSQLHLYRWRD